jgi:hypothetical protein
MKEGEITHDLFGFLTTCPNREIKPVHWNAMPVILKTPGEIELVAPPNGGWWRDSLLSRGVSWHTLIAIESDIFLIASTTRLRVDGREIKRHGRIMAEVHQLSRLINADRWGKAWNPSPILLAR